MAMVMVVMVMVKGIEGELNFFVQRTLIANCIDLKKKKNKKTSTNGSPFLPHFVVLFRVAKRLESASLNFTELPAMLSK